MNGEWTPCPPPLVSLAYESYPRVVQLRPNTYHGGGLTSLVCEELFHHCPFSFFPYLLGTKAFNSSIRIFDIPGAANLKLSQVH